MNEEKIYLGVEIGGTKLQVVVGTGDGTILERFRESVDRERGAEGILESIRRAWAGFKQDHSPVAAGIGFGGPVDRGAGTIAKSYHIDGWDGFNLCEWFEELTGIPAFIENDANAAALAEACCGAGRMFKNVFYTTLGSGMGGGMVQEGLLYHGAVPGEAEIGQTCFSIAGENAETHCSGWSLDRRIRAYIVRVPESPLAALIGGQEGCEARFLLQAIEAGDEGARALFETLVQSIAFTQSHIVHLFHPDVLIYGGGLSLMGEPLREGIERHLTKYITQALQPGPVLKLAELGEDVVGLGALLLAYRDLKLIHDKVR